MPSSTGFCLFVCLFVFFFILCRNSLEIQKYSYFYPCMQNSKKLLNLAKLLSSFMDLLLRLVSLFHENTVF